MMAVSVRVGGHEMSSTAAILAACAVAVPPLAAVAPLGVAPLFAVAAVALLAIDARAVLAASRGLAPLAILLLLLSAWATLSAAWSILPLHSLLEGLRLALIAMGGLVVLGAANALSSEDRRRVGAAAACGVGIALAMLLFVAATDDVITRYRTGRGFVPLTRYDRGATILVLAMWPVVVRIRGGRWFEKVLLAVAVAVTVFALDSQTAVIAVLAGLGVFVVAWYAPRLAAIALAAGMLLSAVVMPLAVPRFATVVALHHDAPSIKYSGIHRLMIWRFTADRIAERPILGWGMDAARELPGGKTDLSKVYPDAGLMPGSDALPLHPHNAVLQWEVELGIPGTVLCLAITVWGLWRVGRSDTLPRLSRAAALAWAASAVAIALLAYGTWQAWWLASLLLTAAAFRAAGAPEGTEVA